MKRQLNDRERLHLPALLHLSNADTDGPLMRFQSFDCRQGLDCL